MHIFKYAQANAYSWITIYIVIVFVFEQYCMCVTVMDMDVWMVCSEWISNNSSHAIICVDFCHFDAISPAVGVVTH